MVKVVCAVVIFLCTLVIAYSYGRLHGVKSVCKEQRMGRLVVDESSEKIRISFIFREDMPVEEILKRDWVVVDVEHK